MAVQAKPDRYHTVTPYLTVEKVAGLIEFMQRAFGGKVVERMEDGEGNVRHAEVQVGDSIVMVGQAREDYPPKPGTLYLYVDDTDATYRAALDAGGISTMEPADQFYGDRNAGVKDQWGNDWWIATHVEDVSSEEAERRMREKMGG